MKKNLFILAVAAFALASCSNDDTVAENVSFNESNAISFSPAINGVTRAANGTGLKTAWESGDILYVYADFNGSKYFDDNFTSNGSGFYSETKYYWPNDISSSKKMTFSAFWGAEQKADTPNELAAAYTVPDAAASQKDLLFAKKVVEAKPANGAGVVLNFRHMLSQIKVKVANDQPNMKITVTGVRVGYVAKTGTFAYGSSEGVTDTQEEGTDNATKIARTDWTPTAATAATQLFDQTISATLTGTVAPASAIDITDGTNGTPWILMPQQLTQASGYTTAATNGPVTTATNPDLNGAYIALKMTIENYNGTATTGTIVSEQWCYWPINTEWKPGYRYIYTINAGSGGYQPTDQNETATDLDPVLQNTAIWFAPTCTIDAWVDNASSVTIPQP